MTEHDRYAFYRSPEPKCSVCYGTNLSITDKKVNRPKSKTSAATCQEAPKPLEDAEESKPQPEYRLSRGKHKGKRLSELSLGSLKSVYASYLDNGNQPKILKACKRELDRRNAKVPKPRNRSNIKQFEKPKKEKKPAKWDGHDEARHQTPAELEEINAVGVPITYVSGWIGGRPDWSDHIPTRDDQLAERALKFGHSS